MTLDQESLTLSANSRATLNATISPLDTYERDVAWGSSDPAVAEVRRIGDQIAMVVGKKPGTCAITAAIENARRTCTVVCSGNTFASTTAVLDSVDVSK